MLHPVVHGVPGLHRGPGAGPAAPKTGANKNANAGKQRIVLELIILSLNTIPLFISISLSKFSQTH